jgi:hypothetical protein
MCTVPAVNARVAPADELFGVMSARCDGCTADATMTP